MEIQTYHPWSLIIILWISFEWAHSHYTTRFDWLCRGQCSLAINTKLCLGHLWLSKLILSCMNIRREQHVSETTCIWIGCKENVLQFAQWLSCIQDIKTLNMYEIAILNCWVNRIMTLHCNYHIQLNFSLLVIQTYNSISDMKTFLSKANTFNSYRSKLCSFSTSYNQYNENHAYLK